jgi:hypothetical protein
MAAGSSLSFLGSIGTLEHLMTSASKTCYALALLFILLIDTRLSNAQRARGELRLEVHDLQGAALACSRAQLLHRPEVP